MSERVKDLIEFSKEAENILEQDSQYTCFECGKAYTTDRPLNVYCPECDQKIDDKLVSEILERIRCLSPKRRKLLIRSLSQQYSSKQSEFFDRETLSKKLDYQKNLGQA